MTDTCTPGDLVVLKFGGTSVSSADRWATLAGIVRQHRAAKRRVLLVCSAVGKTSDVLEALLADAVRPGGEDAVQAHLDALRATHTALAADLGVDAADLVEEVLADIDRRARGMRLLGEVSPRSRANVMAQGELLSTRLGARFLAAQGLGGTWLDARELLRSDVPATRPEGIRYLSATADHRLDEATAETVRAAGPVAITQGFIAADDAGDTVLLGRGGSDTSAAYLAARTGACALEIWTDVPGLFTADPRLVPDARHLETLSYAQAEAMANLGAGVLHPRCLAPARDAGIPIWVRSTPRPDLAGTRISANRDPDGVKAVLTRRHLALLTLRRPSAWQPVGFLADVAGAFRSAGLSIDLISASPSTIQATLDLSACPDPDVALADLLARLSDVGEARLTRGLASLSVVGTGLHRRLDRLAPALSGLAGAAPHMVAPGADDTHVTFVLPPDAARVLAKGLHAALLAGPDADDACLGQPWATLTASRPEVSP